MQGMECDDAIYACSSRHCAVESLDRGGKAMGAEMKRALDLAHTRVYRSKGKDVRATVEQVLDPRTMRILASMCRAVDGPLIEVFGCISTGKEANVYHALGRTESLVEDEPNDNSVDHHLVDQVKNDDKQLNDHHERVDDLCSNDTNEDVEEDTNEQSDEGSSEEVSGFEFFAPDNRGAASRVLEPNACDLAVKVYKTSILVFKDRKRYIEGEHRFSKGVYTKAKNPRKLVATWAEKEMRNLKRMHSAGIPCPRPVALKKHVLVMTLIGEDGLAAPRLRDAELMRDEALDCYWQIVEAMRILFRECRLVHADLSEYNTLYFQKCVHIIDVSQSVEPDHPLSLDFLRMDCRNMTKYFRMQHGLTTLSVKELFEWVATSSSGAQSTLEQLKEEVMRRELEGVPKDVEKDDELFESSYIPRSLDELYDLHAEKPIAATDDYLVLQAMREMLVRDDPASESASIDSDDEADTESESDVGVEKEMRVSSTEDADERKRLRKEHKREVKESQRERRKNKIPKSVKSRKKKISRIRHGKK